MPPFTTGPSQRALLRLLRGEHYAALFGSLPWKTWTTAPNSLGQVAPFCSGALAYFHSGVDTKLLRLACHAANQAGGSPIRRSFVAIFTARYRRIVAEGLAFHEAQPPLDPPGKRKRGRPKRRPGHNLLIRLRDYEDAVLRFLHDPAVPFTNNVAEQGGRMMKVKMKISGCFRTMEGAQAFGVLRSVADTARKQGWNVFDAFKTPSDVLIAKLMTA